MKYLLMIAFNGLALYILIAFGFSKGGIIDNLEKIDRIYQLQQNKYSLMMEIESMKATLSYLSSLDKPDLNLMLQSGKKVRDSVIFKFEEVSNSHSAKEAELYADKQFIKYRIYFLGGIVILGLILGNLILILGIRARV